MATRKKYTDGNQVVALLDEWLEQNSDFSLIEIAERIGVEKSKNCFMSQVRSGRSKLPITKVVPMARVLNQDPRPMMLAVLDQYYPELKDALMQSGLLVNLDNEIQDVRELAKEKRKAS